MESGLTDDEKLSSYIRKFERAAEICADEHDLAARCRDYYDGNQLTSDEITELRKRKQPPIVINRVRRKIDWLRGLEMQSRTDPKAFPRTPQHQQGADAITDALRYSADNADLDRKASAAWDNLLIEGIGAVEVVHSPGPNPDVVINHYPYDRVFHDPHSRLSDFSDARYLGAVIWADIDELKDQYPGEDAAAKIDASVGKVSIDTQKYDDIPAWRVWGDRDRQRVRVVLLWHRESGIWKWVKFVYGGILDGGESPYQEEGQSVCPLMLQGAYIDRNGLHYGVVRDMLDPQDEINKRRSKLLHQLNSRQTMGVKGAISVQKLKQELAKPDGHVEVSPDILDAAREMGMRPFDIIPTTDQTMGQFNLLQEAKAEIDLMGANSGLSGKETSGQSGRAIMAQQQGGLIEIAPLTDAFSDFKRRIYRRMWGIIQQFWREERWIRVTDDERNIRFVGFNRPVSLGERLGQMPPDQMADAAMRIGIGPGDPRLAMQVGVENPVEEIDVDILIEETPDTVTLEGETFQQLVNIATSLPGAVPPEVLIEMAPGLKRDVKDRLLERLTAQSQAQQQAGAAQQEAQTQATQVKIAKDNADAMLAMARAEKTGAEAQRLALGY